MMKLTFGWFASKAALELRVLFRMAGDGWLNKGIRNLKYWTVLKKRYILSSSKFIRIIFFINTVRYWIKLAWKCMLEKVSKNLYLSLFLSSKWNILQKLIDDAIIQSFHVSWQILFKIMLNVNKHDYMLSRKQVELVCFSTKIRFGISAGLKASFDQNINEKVMPIFSSLLISYFRNALFNSFFLLWGLKYSDE